MARKNDDSLDGWQLNQKNRHSILISILAGFISYYRENELTLSGPLNGQIAESKLLNWKQLGKGLKISTDGLYVLHEVSRKRHLRLKKYYRVLDGDHLMSLTPELFLAQKQTRHRIEGGIIDGLCSWRNALKIQASKEISLFTTGRNYSMDYSHNRVTDNSELESLVLEISEMSWVELMSLGRLQKQRLLKEEEKMIEKKKLSSRKEVAELQSQYLERSSAALRTLQIKKTSFPLFLAAISKKRSQIVTEALLTKLMASEEDVQDDINIVLLSLSESERDDINFLLEAIQKAG